MKTILVPLLFCLLAVFQPGSGSVVQAQTPAAQPVPLCDVSNRSCILSEIEKTSQNIENKNWRDQTLRELAKTYAFEGNIEKALSLVDRIETPDTKAMTLRGIGMAVAEHPKPNVNPADVFEKLRAKAQTISHPPSYAIALTYIAMAQAFAGDNEGAWKTAAEMENEALRHKAYAETAEIQADKGDYDAAMKSIGFITSLAFRNKAYEIVARIFADHGALDKALKTAYNITNSYKKAEALQYILDKQKPREAEHAR